MRARKPSEAIPAKPSVPEQALSFFRSRFEALGTAGRAAGAQAYMKSTLHFYGVTAPQLRQTCRSFCAEYPDLSREDLLAMVRSLYQCDCFDLRSAAIGLLECKRSLLQELVAALVAEMEAAR